MAENSSDKENRSGLENKSEYHFVDTIKNTDSFLGEKTLSDQNDSVGKDDISEEGWQEAFPKGRSPMGRKPSASRRPSLAKLNTNFLNASHPSKFRGKPNSFTSPRTSPSENAASSAPAPQGPKKFVKSASFSPKPNGPSAPVIVKEKLANPKSAPATPSLTSSEVAKPSIVSSVCVHAAGKLFSYKEVALAPPGTIVKAVAEQESSAEENLQAIKGTNGSDATESTSKKAEADQTQKLVDKENSVDTVKEINGTSKEKDQHVTIGAVTAVELETAVESSEADNGHELISGAVDSASSEVLDSAVSKMKASEIQAMTDLDSPSGSTDNIAQLVENNVEEERKADSCNESESVGLLTDEEANQDNGSATPSLSETEKQVDTEIGKEPTKKLSAAAPPFNPSTIPVFGSIPLPGYTEHGGILPPPVNIAPVLTVNPARRSPHQSATARVPYGPRLSGGYNRSGSRVPRNRPAFHNAENNGDQNHFSPPRIMNPHANEFVPGQAWVASGYTVAPNGYIATQNGVPFPSNGYPISPNGIPTSPDGFPTLPNGMPEPETQNGLPEASVHSINTPAAEKTEVTDEATHQGVAEENVQLSSTDSTIIPSETSEVQDKVNEETHSEQSKENDCQPEGKCIDTDAESPNVICPEGNSNDTGVEGKTMKRWGDYSDGEAEVTEATN